MNKIKKPVVQPARASQRGNRIKVGETEVRSLMPAAQRPAAPFKSALAIPALKQFRVPGWGPAKALGLLLALLAIAGCESINVNRLAYDFLRQEDCRRNDVDVYEFCSRTFVFEYDEYEQLRQEYIRTEAEKIALEERNRLALKNAAWH